MVIPESAVSDELKRRRVRLARLEADMAYFQARLALIGEPGTTNQLAQRKVFRLLHQSTGGTILNANRDYSSIR